MVTLRVAAGILFSGTLVLGAGMAYGQATSTSSGQAYPYKPIRIITSLPGGATDFVARLVAAGISGPLGQQVIVDSRPSSVTADLTMNAQPDGYTLLVEAGSMWFATLLQKTTYDVLRDFIPITPVIASPLILVVHPGVAANSVKDLIALAKARSGGLNYGSSTAGSSSHLAGALFNSMAGVNIQWIPFKGTGPAMAEMIGGGQVHVMFPNATGVMPHIKSGRLKSLAVTSAKPSALAPGLPTVASAGLPGYEAETVYEILAPALTPAVIVNQLNREVVGILTGLDFREKFGNAGLEVVASTPQQLAAIIRSDMVKMGKVIREAGIRAD